VSQPIDLTSALATFDELWSPRIAARVNDYDVRITKVAGEYIWHVHTDTDEFFMVLDGELTIELRENGAERSVVLPKNSVYVVPRGIEHRPVSPAGASIMVIEPAGHSTVGDRHDDIPGHIDVTTGHRLTG
jgi:mannose-6-phosphate isomerase-like protein (cupin superfamily)